MSQEVRVAFAGHNRPEDLRDQTTIEAALRRTVDLICAAGVERAVLTTGLAEGADSLAVKVWSERGLGPVHAVLPFLTEEPGAEQPDVAARRTVLDGAAIEAKGRSPHLVQTRWLIEDADLLIVVWNGEVARGAGGTSDAVRLALKSKVPALWVDPAKPAMVRLIAPEAVDEDFSFLEVLELLQRDEAPLVREASVERVKAYLRPSLEPSPSTVIARPAPAGRVAQAIDRLLEATVWRSFFLYRQVIGGRPEPAPPSMPPPPSLAAQAGFQILTEAYEAADETATRLAAVHRSQQVFQASVMLLAAAVGSSPTVWPGFKIYAVLGELGLGLAAFGVWFSGVRSGRSRRWGEARHVAELLRLERAAWALGISTRSEQGFDPEDPAIRVARACRRQAGSPGGRFDARRTADWGAWAMDQLLTSQIAYHEMHGRLNERLSHRTHAFEGTIFWVFIAILASFAASFALAPRLGFELPHWVGGAVIMAGAITPAFGAASLALEASLSFARLARHSEVITLKLQALRDRLPAEPTLEEFQRVCRAAVRFEATQEHEWRDETTHRHVIRAG